MTDPSVRAHISATFQQFREAAQRHTPFGLFSADMPGLYTAVARRCRVQPSEVRAVEATQAEGAGDGPH